MWLFRSGLRVSVWLDAVWHFGWVLRYACVYIALESSDECRASRPNLLAEPSARAIAIWKQRLCFVCQKYDIKTPFMIIRLPSAAETNCDGSQPCFINSV